jgi:hypothetical protein
MPKRQRGEQAGEIGEMPSPETTNTLAGSGDLQEFPPEADLLFVFNKVAGNP